MSDLPSTDDMIEAFSLYIELEPGTKADLETVSNSALAFVSAVRELAYILDPSLDLRVEFVSGTEGSFSLNAWLRSLNPKDLLSKKTLLLSRQLPQLGLRSMHEIGLSRSFLNIWPGWTRLPV